MLSQLKNWETLNQLSHDHLQIILSTGICCTVPELDREFRLWFWRYCEMSDACMHQGVSLLLLIVCSAVMEEMDSEVLMLILQKLASFLRIPTLCRTAMHLLVEEYETDWRPEMFDAILQLLRQNPVFTVQRRRIFLLPVANIVARLLESLSSFHGKRKIRVQSINQSIN